MKKNILFAGLLALAFNSATAKEKDAPTDYVRSSLFTIIIDDHGLLDEHRSEMIKENFITTPIPDKFNDHNLDNTYRIFKPANYSVTEEEAEALNGGKKGKGGFGKFAQSVAGEASGGIVDTTQTHKIPAQFIKYFEDQKIGNQLVAKWYNASSNYNSETSSFFDMELIKERGLYNATEIDKSLADKSARGLSLLADAGENLIGNTFVVGVRFNYVDKAEIAEQAKKTANTLGKFGGVGAAIGGAMSVGADIAGKGYVIKATAYLFQLDWTDEVSNEFYNNFYNNTDLSEFMNSDIFSLKYIGSATQWADVQSTTFTNTTDDELVMRAANRSVDAVIAKLQKEFEVFRTKTPLISTDPEITAYIGMKEGVDANSKFEVLEKEVDEETGITKYKKVGTLKVKKGKIWDNRYAADEERTEAEANGEEVTEVLNATTLTGNSKNLYPGMLIRQVN